jgi:hypothetical protein
VKQSETPDAAIPIGTYSLHNDANNKFSLEYPSDWRENIIEAKRC